MAEGVRKNKYYIAKIVGYVLIVLIVAFAVFPIVWTGISSFKVTRDIITPVPRLIFTPTLRNYIELFQLPDIQRGLVNSLIIVPAAVLLGFVAGIPASYIFARFTFRGREDLRFWVITLRMLPPVAIVIPFTSIWIRLGLYDAKAALIITYLLITLPIIIWLSIESFRRIPIECEEAAMVEGCSYFQVFWKIAFPLALPTLIGGLLFTFILLWNEYFIAFALSSRHSMTMPVAAAAFAVSGLEVPWGRIAASIITLSIPPLILTSIFRGSLQSYFVPSDLD